LVTAFAGAACCPRYFATLSSFSFMGCGVFGRGAKKKIHGLEGVPPPSSSVRQDPTLSTGRNTMQSAHHGGEGSSIALRSG
jgi:hypothetical protein